MLRCFAFDLQHFAKQVVGRSNARRAVAHWFGFGCSDVLLQVLEWGLPANQQDHWRFYQHANMGEIIHSVERHGAPGHGRVHVHGGVAHQQGVAVRWLLGDVIGANQATGASAVFNDDCLPERLREVRCHQP